ncbi:cupin domain-containing protein [Skeletonema marinoi]|uniref:Cupin domain-containing protein n=1 Tax=Skeletonema marinoi TaxID=267567 RepID=A0AAD9DC87_9STRA|nr:cupin domain-containing protein [Skeletonema marinoi]
MAKVLTSIVLLSSSAQAFLAWPITSRNDINSHSSLKMSEIEVVSQPDKDFLEKKGVFNWGTWGCGVSKFPWTYDQSESCYLLAGKVTVTPDDKSLKPAEFGKEDFVTFPAGMSCTWDVSETVEKHFMFF